MKKPEIKQKRLNIVVVFDAILRPETTGRYVVRALRNLGHNVSQYMPTYKNGDSLVFKNYSDLLLDEVDFLLYVDDDINYPVSATSIPKYYWCIDTHRMDNLVNGSTRWERLKLFDLSFLAQKDRADEVGGNWLPLAYDPSVWRTEDAGKRYDWCFVGNLNPKREEFFNAIRAVYPNCFVGNAYFDEANKIYNQSWLALNLTFSNDINMRFYEAQATSALFMSNRVHNGEASLFSEVEYFDDVDHCLARMRALLADKGALAKKAARQAKDMKLHTYEARMQALLVKAGWATGTPT